ncbi:DUF5995 family protein [Angustibacter sp. McL0619]|uniref:DUF5995 family protein n=1 Tax=Angustibacter sp. McL0619 TaxID=3415676 RepID=UPI003CEAA92B
MAATPVVSVQDVIERMQRIEDELKPDDGAAVFNRMYLTVTEKVVAALAAEQVFHDPIFMAELDVTFAGLWLAAYDSSAPTIPKAWAPLFERRHETSLLPIQFALAGMNAHIAHDLPVALNATCRQLRKSPDDATVRADYEKVNDLLAACENEIRRSFLNEAEQAVDQHLSPVVHLIDSWNIDRARDVAWVNAEAMWAIRGLGPLAGRYEVALARTVGMASRCLLTSVLAA